MERLGDDELRSAFEAGTLRGEQFHHADHVRMAWLYLRELPLAEALDRFPAGIRRLAQALDKPGLYHETITWAYVLLIHERMARGGVREGAGESWEDFAARHPDLLTWKPSALDAYYSAETLSSELARRVFLLPDRIAGAAATPPDRRRFQLPRADRPDHGPAGAAPGGGGADGSYSSSSGWRRNGSGHICKF
jgi:hypothetical protein